MPLADMFWGDRYGQITDPFGHKWSMSQTLQVMSDEEMVHAADDALASKGDADGRAGRLVIFEGYPLPPG